ncbi:MAG: hypothetical protein Edafosvirus51_5, partial [Edafosvirus sp.]
SLSNILKWIDEIKEYVTICCTYCEIYKPFYEFNPINRPNGTIGRRHTCIWCQSKNNKNQKSEGDGFINKIIRKMNERAQNKKDKKNNKAGICKLKCDDIIALYDEQEKKCFLSNIPMTLKSNCDWTLSIKKLNSNLGYIKKNVVLICKEMHCSIPWTKKKIELIEDLIKDGFDYNKLLKSIEYAHKLIENEQDPIIILKDNIDFIKCLICELILKKSCYKSKSSICNDCQNDNLSELYIFLSDKFTRSRDNAKKKKNNTFSLDLNMLLDKIIEQKGKCQYSNIPLVFQSSKDWMMSIELINNMEGYTNKNTILICTEFQITNNSVKWSKEKFNHFLECIKKKIEN